MKIKNIITNAITNVLKIERIDERFIDTLRYFIYDINFKSIIEFEFEYIMLSPKNYHDLICLISSVSYGRYYTDKDGNVLIDTMKIIPVPSLNDKIVVLA